MNLSEAEVTQAVDALKKYLPVRPPAVSPKPGAPMVADIPAAVLAVAGDDGQADRGQGRGARLGGRLLPKGLRRGRSCSTILATKATEKNEKYTADRVRVVAESVPTAEVEKTPWSAEKLPDPSGQIDLRVAAGPDRRPGRP